MVLLARLYTTEEDDLKMQKRQSITELRHIGRFILRRILGCVKVKMRLTGSHLDASVRAQEKDKQAGAGGSDPDLQAARIAPGATCVFFFTWFGEWLGTLLRVLLGGLLGGPLG